MELKQQRHEESRRQLDELRVMEAEEYNELKIKLETEIQTLEQHLQEVASTAGNYSVELTFLSPSLCR
jgi:dynein regulatory complex protein 1